MITSLVASNQITLKRDELYYTWRLSVPPPLSMFFYSVIPRCIFQCGAGMVSVL